MLSCLAMLAFHIGVQAGAPAAPPPIQLPAHSPGKAMEDGLREQEAAVWSRRCVLDPGPPTWDGGIPTASQPLGRRPTHSPFDYSCF